MYKGEDIVIDILKNGPLTIASIAQKTNINEDSIRRIVESLKGGGFVIVDTQSEINYLPSEELLLGITKGFPEYSVFFKALKNASVSDLDDLEKTIGIRWAKQHGFVSIEGGKLVATKTQEEMEKHILKLKKGYDQIVANGKTNDDLKIIQEEFIKRKMVSIVSKITTTVKLTEKLYISSGFDINVPGPDAQIGKSHPITNITNKIKNIMSELGFTEIEGSIVESSFWNFDALFQPQDHPARDLADTFYLDRTTDLPDKKLVSKVKQSHEQGWKYSWDEEKARKSVLRTHTTCLSARNLAMIDNNAPKKLFAIGRVFRNEATDYSHLAEFHQVEGIIAYDKATFSDLLGILKIFYSKLGFEKIRFRPSYFPYTEPSVEIEVYFEEKGKWLELGGAGIFRPEVTIPLCGRYPVLAWGLSLERPLMLALELNDIRTFYKNDLDFLRNTRLNL